MIKTRTKPGKTGNTRGHFERNNYYFGKMMTVRDFQSQQSYDNEKRWLLNRLGLGWGVLCGLKVLPHPQGGARVIVKPGLALDQYGNEIWVFEEQILDLAANAPGEPPATSPPQPGTCYYLSVQYLECPVEPTPIPVEDCEKPDTGCVYNRTRETFKLLVSYDSPAEPEKPAIFDEHGCRVDCFRALHDPTPLVIEQCPERRQCQPVPLAQICHDENAPNPLLINNAPPYRKLAFSNEALRHLLECLERELWISHAARYDRRQFVPLLAQTIKGLEYRGGKLFTHAENVGKHPCRLTTDGKFIWITDCEDEHLVRIRRRDNTVVTDPPIQLEMKNWGIAYDSQRMWVTHHESADPENGMGGQISWVNVCNFANGSIGELKDYPREIVFDGRYLWISHHKAVEEERAVIYYLSLTVIDPRSGSVAAVYEAPLPTEAKSTIKGMAFDGDMVWMIYHVTGRNGLVAAHLQDGSIVVEEPRECGTDEPEDVAFDGTHIWVSGKDGAFKIDIYGDKDPISPFRRRDHSALAFDGKYMWAAQYKEYLFNRVDTLNPEKEAGGEEIEIEGEDYQVSRMCFDGHYLWAAASVAAPQRRTPAKTQSPENETPRQGLVHRLLA
ncbi:MAG: hypothetical protein HUU32_08295 [Calditrichaceae bacterium]|nr:hypothetical protein [Calditrichia bacterium]NUQ41376.1 hypothetical protein [Calditrichaceae bacterium]